jgi:cobalamin biosynthesis Mg chelatase CobN
MATVLVKLPEKAKSQPSGDSNSEAKPATPATPSEFAHLTGPERARAMVAAAREQHQQESDAQRSSDPNKNQKNKSASTPTSSYQYSSSEREKSSLVRGLVKVIVVSAIVGSVYYGLGSYYGFDRVNKPFEDTYRYIKTSITKILP